MRGGLCAFCGVVRLLRARLSLVTFFSGLLRVVFESEDAFARLNQFGIGICSSCLDRASRAFGKPPKDTQAWQRAIQQLADKQAEELTEHDATWQGADSLPHVNFWPACWFTGLPFCPELRLVRGLPAVELYGLGFRLPEGCHLSIPRVAARMAALHADDAWELSERAQKARDLCFRDLSASLGIHDRETLESLALCRPAICDALVYTLTGALAWNPGTEPWPVDPSVRDD